MPRKAAPKSVSRLKKAKPSPVRNLDEARELVIITGLSGSGKLSALKAFEDLGYYAVYNMPIELVPRFAELIAESAATNRAALVVDVREGQGLERFPTILKQIRKPLPPKAFFLEAHKRLFLRA